MDLNLANKNALITGELGRKSLSDGIRVLAVSRGACGTERLVGLMRNKA